MEKKRGKESVEKRKKEKKEKEKEEEEKIPQMCESIGHRCPKREEEEGGENLPYVEA